MFRLSNRTDYGLILLASLAGQKNPVPIAHVAKNYSISPKFLSKIALDLKSGGILSSKEGVTGGYTLAKRPREIKLTEVLRILDGDVVSGGCFEEGHECICGAKDMWGDVQKGILSVLRGKTVADLRSLS
jgi:Rrf2 family protein